MSLFRRLFGATNRPEVESARDIDDTDMSATLTHAVDRHKRISAALQDASYRQLREADYIRETLKGVLGRIEERKQHG